MKFRKTISPVVATALLIIIVVAAIVGFQTWYQTYQSNIFTNSETQSKTSNQIRIETLTGNTLYIKGDVNTSIQKIIIDGQECSFVGNITGIQDIDVSDCIKSLTTSTPEIVVQTKNNIFSKKIYFKKFNSSISYIYHWEESEWSVCSNNCGDGIQTKIINCVRNDNLVVEDSFCDINTKPIDTMDCSSTSGCLILLNNSYWISNLNLNGSKLNWLDAGNYCSNLVYLEYDDWYLPQKSQWYEITEGNYSCSKMINLGFNNCQRDYWTSTEYDSSNAYDIFLEGGIEGFYIKTMLLDVVCVRDN